MINAAYVKQPSEIETLKVDWSDRVNNLGISGYAISAVEVKVFDTAGIDVTTSMLEGSPTYSGTDIIFTLKNGTTGTDYYARIKVTLTKATYITLLQEEDLLINVRQKGS
jgi:hypothetical protein